MSLLSSIQSIESRILEIEYKLVQLDENNELSIIQRFQLVKQNYQQWLERNTNIASIINQINQILSMLNMKVDYTCDLNSVQAKAILLAPFIDEFLASLKQLHGIKQSIHAIDEATPVLKTAIGFSGVVQTNLMYQIQLSKQIKQLETQIFNLVATYQKAINRISVLHIGFYDRLKAYEKKKAQIESARKPGWVRGDVGGVQ